MRNAFWAAGLSLAILSANVSFAANILVTANNVLAPFPRVGIGVNAASSGRTCGKIGGIAVAQDPAGSCAPLNGPIPPNRVAAFADVAGNSVDGESDKIPGGFLKGWFVSASATSVTKNVFDQSEFVDPITFTNLSGDSFDITLTNSFEELGSTPGLQLSGDPGSDGAYHLDMSSDLTGSLFSLDITFAPNQPLGVTVNLGAFLSGDPNWDSLQSDLATALGASTPGQSFSLANFTFPDINISVPAGESLTVSSDAEVTGNAAVPEPGTFALLGLTATCLCLISSRRSRRCPQL